MSLRFKKLLKKKTSCLVLGIALFCLLLLSFSFVLAEEGRKLEVEYPEISKIKPEVVKTGLPEYVKYIFNFAILISGLILFGALIWNGFLYLTSAGRVSKLKEAKEGISAAFLGVIILFSTYILFSTINPQLLIFPLSPIEPLEKEELSPLPPIKPEQASLISEELPIGQAVEKGLWQEKRTNELKNLIESFKGFLKSEINVNPLFERISDLNKYLTTLIEGCRCDRLTAICADPSSGAQAVACIGDDVCDKEDRKKIKKILKINEEKMEALLNFQKEIDKRKNILLSELAKYQETEEEIFACRSQGNELASLNEYLSMVEFFEEQGHPLTKIAGYLESRGDPLTFYCGVGGTIFDYPYTQRTEEIEEMPEPEISSEEIIGAGMEKLHCPVEFPTGEIFDKARELTVLTIIKLGRLNDLIENMTAKINRATELVSRFNKENCQPKCNCLPNPCYQICCVPPFCGFCTVANCQGLCIMSTGGCFEIEPFPREELREVINDIKDIEDEIFLTIKKINQIFPQASFILKDPSNPKNLKNLRTSVGLCYSQSFEVPGWTMSTCQEAVNSYGPKGQIISGCHPRSFYCCSYSEEEMRERPIPSVGKGQPVYIVQPEEYPDLAVEDNCPQGWLCDQEVKDYNQYNDASPPLKSLLSCMRKRLDKTQKEKEIKETLGRISAISDPKIYQGTCNWLSGPENAGGCSYVYEQKKGKERVSAHYGGISCRIEKQSYAFDVGTSSLEEKKHVEEIIKAAKECDSRTFISYHPNGNLHISLGGAYNCNSD